MATIPTTEPEKITAGDTVKWYKSVTDYTPDTATLTYRFVPQFTDSSDAAIDPTSVTGADNSDDRWLVTVSAAVSGALDPGDYKWYAQIIDGTEVYTVDSGTFTVFPDPTATSYDARTHVKKTLDAINAVIEGKATKDQEAWTVEGRSVSRYSFESLMALRDKYQVYYREELAAEKIARGLGGGRNIRVRF